MGELDEPGDLVVSASMDEVLDAIEALDLERAWEEVAPDLRLVLPRRRPLPPGTGEVPRRLYPPGLLVGLGLDIGPAMVFVADAQLRRWAVTEDQAFARAEANVRARCRARRQFGLVHQVLADVPTTWFQSREGWASALLVMPEELGRVMGVSPGIVLAPMRDLLISVPLDTSPEFIDWILDEFAQADMNALAVPPVVVLGGQLVVAQGGGMEVSHAPRVH